MGEVVHVLLLLLLLLLLRRVRGVGVGLGLVVARIVIGPQKITGGRALGQGQSGWGRGWTNAAAARNHDRHVVKGQEEGAMAFCRGGRWG